MATPNPGPSQPVGSTSDEYFQQLALKGAMEDLPKLEEENYTIWRDKMIIVFELRGIKSVIESDTATFSTRDHLATCAIIISKLNSTTPNNVVTSKNHNCAKTLWRDLKDRFMSLQAANRARIFNDFLHLLFREDAIDNFLTLS